MQQGKILKNIVLTLTILSLFLGHPHESHAQIPGLGSVAGSLTGLGNIPTQESGAIKKKEVGLNLVLPSMDAIAWGAAKLLVRTMTNSLVSWINSGFDGKPLFATDPEKFLLDIGDQVAGSYIQSIGAGALCSPFKLQIQGQLRIAYNRARLLGQTDRPFEGTCTLSGTAENIQAFFDGDFDKGGWDQWYSMTQVPGNNPYGAIAEASGELSIKIAGAKELELAKLNWGQGFIGWSDCIEKDANGKCTKRGPTKTPGSVINGELQKRLGSNIDQLNLADEFNEVITAAIGLVVNKFIGGSNGVFSNVASGGDIPSGGDVGETIPGLPAKLTIFLLEEETIYLAYGETYIEPGYEALDPYEGYLSQNVIVSGADTINPQVPGTYLITYTVSNSRGEIVTATRTIIVGENQSGGITP